MGRKKENKIYSMFAYDETTNKSKCLMEGCNVHMKGNHAGNLLRHFYAQHRLKHDELVNMNMQAKENLPQRLSDNAAAVMGFCTDLVTIHGRPFNIVEDEAFKNILKLIPGMSQKETQAINVKNIKENIRKKAYEVRLKISKQLSTNLISLKVDVASVKLRRFLGLNVQYISDGQINLRNLSVVELHDRNTAEYLKENVVMTLSRYGIQPMQLLTITTDNGSNMLCMVKELNDAASILTSESSDNESINEMDYSEVNEFGDLETTGLQLEDTNERVRTITGIRCAAHCLQLAVNAACRDLKDFLERCRQIVRKLRTPNMALKLKEENLPQAVLDTPTRWDSTADMLDNLKTLKTFCVTNMTVEPEVWTQLAVYLEILLPCRILSKRLQTEQLTCGDFYLAWMQCRHHLSQIGDAFALRLESLMVDREAVLFENDHFLAAIYLDPRVNSILNTNQASTARRILVEIYRRIVNLKQHLQSPQDPQVTDPIPGTSNSSIREIGTVNGHHSFDDYLRNQFANNDRANRELSLDDEIIFKLVTFLQEPVLPANSNILKYWTGKESTEPYLFALAKVVLATPPTSVSVERLFSSLKFILNNLRMRLNDSIIEDIMVLRNNHVYSK